jgi:hypothetical protein
VNHKLAFSCGHADVVAARSARIMCGPTFWWWPTLRVLGLHEDAANGALTNCLVTLWHRATTLPTTQLSYSRRYEQSRAMGVHCVA